MTNLGLQDWHTGNTVAVKALKKKAVIMNNDVDDAFTERDVLCLAATRGPCDFIAQLIMTYQTPGQLFFVMEFISGGDLMFHIQESGRSFLLFFPFIIPPVHPFLLGQPHRTLFWIASSSSI